MWSGSTTLYVCNFIQYSSTFPIFVICDSACGIWDGLFFRILVCFESFCLWYEICKALHPCYPGTCMSVFYDDLNFGVHHSSTSVHLKRWKFIAAIRGNLVFWYKKNQRFLVLRALRMNSFDLLVSIFPYRVVS